MLRFIRISQLWCERQVYRLACLECNLCVEAATQLSWVRRPDKKPEPAPHPNSSTIERAIDVMAGDHERRARNLEVDSREGYILHRLTFDLAKECPHTKDAQIETI